MSVYFAYIATKTTADPYIPPRAVNVDILSRDVSDSFAAISGGRLEVGRLAFYPVQRSVPNHLLCDGREVLKTSFPELYAYLGETEGVAADPLKFKLPDYVTAVPAAATVADPETTNTGTVSTPAPIVPPETYYPEQSDPVWGDVDSGGRKYDRIVNEP
jgi:hypothetical protein